MDYKKIKDDDIDFWINLESTLDNKTKKVQNAKKNNETVKITMDAEEGLIAIKEINQTNWPTIIPFRGVAISGFFEKIFDKREENLLKDEIYETYLRNNKYLNASQKEAVFERLEKNVDIQMYKALRTYDMINYWGTDKSQAYINAMLKNVKVKRRNTTSKAMQEKEDSIRRKALRDAGIVLSYDLNKILFNKNNPIDNIRLIKNAIKNRRFAEIKFLGKTFNPENKKITKPKTLSSQKVIQFKKKQKQKVPLKLKKKAPVKKYTSKESLIQKFKNKVNSENWKSTVKKGLVTAGIIGFVGLSAFSLSKIENYKPTSNIPAQTETAISTSTQELSSKDTIQDIVDDSIKIVQNNTISDANIVKDDNKPTTTQNVTTNDTTLDKVETVSDVDEKIVLHNALMESLNLGFDTQFSMGNGRYYEGPSQYGRSGSYSNISNKVQINYVDAIENGVYRKYTIQDGMSIADIKAANPNAEFSYHVITDSGIMLGWNDADQNNIETNLIKGALMELKPYLSTEAMEFLCNNSLDAEVSSNEFAKYAEELEIAKTQMLKNNHIEKEIEK